MLLFLLLRTMGYTVPCKSCIYCIYARWALSSPITRCHVPKRGKERNTEQEKIGWNQLVFFLLKLDNIATCLLTGTALGKWQICQARQLRGQGNPMSLSTMSTILKQSTQLLMSGKTPERANAVKMKPSFERLLVIKLATYAKAKVVVSEPITWLCGVVHYVNIINM